MTKSQINKLGEMLRRAGTISDGSLQQLQQFRDEYDLPMERTQRLLQETLGIETTARLKTTNTIIEKLRREKTRLSEMQDIAGLRVVRDCGLFDQDRLVGGIVDLLPEASVTDRRKTPSHGYRAVHVIATVEGHRVEIQVRTEFQHLWAQAVEKLADRAGREIRYGIVPAGWEDRVATLMTAAREVASIEQQVEELRELTESLAAPAIDSIGALQVNRLHARVGALRATLGERPSRVREFLSEQLLE